MRTIFAFIVSTIFLVFCFITVNVDGKTIAFWSCLILGNIWLTSAIIMSFLEGNKYE